MRVSILTICVIIGLFDISSAVMAQAALEKKGKDSSISSLLQQKVVMSTPFSYNFDYVMQILAKSLLDQNDQLITIEKLEPVNDPLIPKIFLSSHPLIEWLIFLKKSNPSLKWSISDDTVHILLSSSNQYPNILNQRLTKDCSGFRTLEEWQHLINDQHPDAHCFFNDNGRGSYVFSHDDKNYSTEWKTRKFSFSAKKGMTLRTYLTKLARAYGGCYWVADLCEQPDPTNPFFKPNDISFLTVRHFGDSSDTKRPSVRP